MVEEPPPKILVRACNGDLWLIKAGAIPELVHSQLNLQPKNQALVNFLAATDDNLANLFESANPGVRVGITVVDI